MSDSTPLCECGCGDAPRPGNRFLHGHHARVRNPMSSAASREKVAASKRGARHPRWQDSPTYTTIHVWLNRNFPKTGVCAGCGETKRTEWANISGAYRRDIGDYRELCSQCHHAADGTGAKAAATRRERYGPKGYPDHVKMGMAALTPEQRTARMLKAWETRRANVAASAAGKAIP